MAKVVGVALDQETYALLKQYVMYKISHFICDILKKAYKENRLGEIHPSPNKSEPIRFSATFDDEALRIWNLIPRRKRAGIIRTLIKEAYQSGYLEEVSKQYIGKRTIRKTS